MSIAVCLLPFAAVMVQMPVKMSDAMDDEKKRLRQEAVARRDALPAEQRQAAAETIAARKFPLPITPGAIVSGFMPLNSEINPLPLLRVLHERRAAGAAGGGGARQTADHAGVAVRRAARSRAVGHSRADSRMRRKSSPIFSWCRCWRSTAPAAASVMGQAITI